MIFPSSFPSVIKHFHSANTLTTAWWFSLSPAVSSDFSVWDWVHRTPQISPKNQELKQKQTAFWLPASLWLWNRNQRLLGAEGNRLTNLPPLPPGSNGIIYLKRSKRKNEESIHSRTGLLKCRWQRERVLFYPGSHSTLKQWPPTFWSGKMFCNNSFNTYLFTY